MQPTLFHIGSISVYTISVFLSIAFLASTFIIWREGRRRNFDEEKILDLVVLVVLLGILIGRLNYILLNPALFSAWQDYLFFWKIPGISLSGFVFGSLLSAFLLIRKYHWPLALMFDALTLGVLLGASIFSLGLFFSGSGYGIETGSVFGVRFLGVPGKRIPISLAEALLFFILFIVLFVINRKKMFPKGLITSLSLLYFGIITALAYVFEVQDSMKSPRLTLLSRLAIIILGLALLLAFIRKGPIRIPTTISEFIRRFLKRVKISRKEK